MKRPDLVPTDFYDLVALTAARKQQAKEAKRPKPSGETANGLKTQLVDLSKPVDAAKRYLDALSHPDTLLYLKPVTSWRKSL